jgi:hypothetical protein
VKLLLDTHHSRRAAERLRQAGFDVVAAADDPMLAELSDDELLRYAASQRRALVTENAKDFDRIVRAWAAAGERHAGVIFTSPRRYHRGQTAYPHNLAGALEDVLAKPDPPDSDWVIWLP